MPSTESEPSPAAVSAICARDDLIAEYQAMGEPASAERFRAEIAALEATASD